MKSINEYIQEKLIIKKSKYKYFPKTKEELQELLKQLIEERGNEGDFNDIDTSEITDMSNLFYGLDHFNGDISNWDVSNVTDMKYIFCRCKAFNQYIYNWDVSNVKDMSFMFYGCKLFNQDISRWDVSDVIDMSYMFYGCKSFNQDISSWDVVCVKNNFNNIFSFCKIEKKYKPKFR